MTTDSFDISECSFGQGKRASFGEVFTRHSKIGLTAAHVSLLVNEIRQLSTPRLLTQKRSTGTRLVQSREAFGDHRDNSRRQPGFASTAHFESRNSLSLSCCVLLTSSAGSIEMNRNRESGRVRWSSSIKKAGPRVKERCRG